jgi:AraC-like DNA-binding protein/mannose-6-phosphate isomerase-like protein (cupin superfamily)
MAYYTTYGQMQNEMRAYYMRTGRKLQFLEMSDYLARKGMLQESINFPEIKEDYGIISDEDFGKIVDSIPIMISTYSDGSCSHNAVENNIIPREMDAYVIRHPRYARPELHSHDYFEVNFVTKGTATFYFEEEERTMQEGEICIVAPSSMHEIMVNGESTAYAICIRQSTFNTTFFALMSRKDLLSYFFRTILLKNNHANYLLFFTKRHHLLQKYMRHLMIESYTDDEYHNSCCISYIYLFFSEILRNYSDTIQFYDYKMGTDFSLVLQYIQYNYRTLTLASLAELFHYSEPHLCTLIKQNTGYTFTELIRRMRMSDATNYLLNTDMKISEIAKQVGYNSADHFSRVFKAEYKISPQEYRK